MKRRKNSTSQALPFEVDPAVQQAVGTSVENLAALYIVQSIKGFGPQKERAGVRLAICYLEGKGSSLLLFVVPSLSLCPVAPTRGEVARLHTRFSGGESPKPTPPARRSNG